MYCEQFAARIATRSPCLAPFSCRTVASRLQRDHNCRYVMRWSSKMTAIRSGAVCIARFRGSTNVGITARLFFARSNREIPVRYIPHQVRGAFYSCGYEHWFPPEYLTFERRTSGHIPAGDDQIYPMREKLSAVAVPQPELAGARNATACFPTSAGSVMGIVHMSGLQMYIDGMPRSG